MLFCFSLSGRRSPTFCPTTFLFYIKTSAPVVRDDVSRVSIFLSSVSSFFPSHSSIRSPSDVYSLCKPNILWGPGVLECKGSAEAGRERLHYPHQRAGVNSHNQCFPITHSSLPLPLSASLSNQINMLYWHEWKFDINIGKKKRNWTTKGGNEQKD